MKQAVAALLGAGFTVAACYATGVLLLAWLRLNAFLRRGERWPLAFTLGAAGVHLLMFTLLAVHAMYWPVALGLLAAIIAAAIKTGAWQPRGFEFGYISPALKWIAGIPAALFLCCYFVYAWAPEHSPDGSSYHLGIVSRVLNAHYLERIATNFYAMLGQGVEMVYVPAFAIGRHSAAALTHLAFGVALAFALFRFGCRIGKPWVGATAALLFFLSPVAGKDTSIAYVDVATAAIVFSAFYWLELWDREHNVSADAWRLLIPAGLMAGYAYAAKYTAALIGIYAIGFVLLRARRLRPVLTVAACAVLMAGPWIARNWILYHNPVAPFENKVFRNPYVHVMFEQEYTEYFRHYELKDLHTLPLDITIRGTVDGVIGPVFLLLPLGLLALRWRAGRHVWIAGAIVFSLYFSNISARFLIPTLPFASLAIAMGIGEIPWLLTILILVHAVLSWPTVIPRYSNPYAWRLEAFPLKEALRRTDPDAFLNQVSQGYTAARMMEAKVPEGRPVFAKNGASDAYTKHEIRVSFQSASNAVLNDIFDMAWDLNSQSTRSHIFHFPERTGRSFRVVQTVNAANHVQWSVHELRFYHKGVELARAPEWRLQAWPNPWDVQMAFDNSPATRWRSWETSAAGMYIQVDFGRDETVDEIRVESSPDSQIVGLSVAVPDASGKWTPFDAKLENVDTPLTLNARRLATYEIHRRGVDYFLLYDTDFGADDVREDPESWGLREIANSGGIRLYKSVW